MFFWLRFNKISSLTLLLLRLNINEFPAYGVSWFAFKIESPVSRDLIWLYHCKMNCTRLIWIWCDSLCLLDSNWNSSTSAMKVHLLTHSLIRLKRTDDILLSVIFHVQLSWGRSFMHFLYICNDSHISNEYILIILRSMDVSNFKHPKNTNSKLNQRFLPTALWYLFFAFSTPLNNVTLYGFCMNFTVF